MNTPSAILKALPQLRLAATRQMSVVSGPPKVRISMAEKAVHGLVLATGMLVLPAWILVNIRNYKARD